MKKLKFYYPQGSRRYLVDMVKEKFFVKRVDIIEPGFIPGEGSGPISEKLKIKIGLSFWAIILDRNHLEKEIENFIESYCLPVGVSATYEYYMAPLIKTKTIYRNETEKYLVRYSIFNCRFFAVKIHNILLSDDNCLHDHPWQFVSLILWGGYVEHTEKGSKIYHPGQLLKRPAEFKHRLEIHQPAWTLVVTFKKTREWGFWAPEGFVKWFNYKPNNNCE